MLLCCIFWLCNQKVLYLLFCISFRIWSNAIDFYKTIFQILGSTYELGTTVTLTADRFLGLFDFSQWFQYMFGNIKFNALTLNFIKCCLRFLRHFGHSEPIHEIDVQRLLKQTFVKITEEGIILLLFVMTLFLIKSWT